MSGASLAVIPARGGSKRLPGKNIRAFRGKPMIAWSIEAARATGLFRRIVVSTDSDEIARVAEGFGAEVPFVRPAQLADDHAGTVPVILHAIEALQALGHSFDHVCCIYPAAPLIQPADLAQGLALLQQGWSFAFPVTTFSASTYRGLLKRPDGGTQMLFPQYRDTRTQDLPQVYYDAGQFYWGKTQSWLAGEDVYGPTGTTIVLPRWRVQDIDTLEDFERAELLFDLLARRDR